ncbi:Uncharacterized protein APZ42_017826 [Daphnia magna]|uniref:Uncharacterized protein n=1 Tax=Daphnia magna TaxID=35525 RepID=A0A164ZJC3_9CRUS|nr:Uncharacterized protein APZ42_017826 [Daphnia magna]
MGNQKCIPEISTKNNIQQTMGMGCVVNMNVCVMSFFLSSYDTVYIRSYIKAISM